MLKIEDLPGIGMRAALRDHHRHLSHVNSFNRHGSKTIALLLFVLVAMLFILPAPSARADYVMLRDGRTLLGDVVEANTASVRLRYRENGIESTLTIPLSNIIRWDYDDATKIGGPNHPETRKDRDDPAGPTPAGAANPETNPGVVVIPLRGQVGGLTDGTVRDTFDSTVLRTCLDKAIEENAALVILDIHSPGGLVAEMEAICETLLEYRDKIRIVAFPTDAFSAAAIISLCCEEIVVRPESRLGAAVIVRQNREGMNALEAKFASVHHAKQRQFMDAIGRPYEVVAAMTIQETELWWSPEGGFTNIAPNTGTGWELVDQKSTVLTLTADQALRYGIAVKEAPNTRTLLARLDLDPDLPMVSYADDMLRYANDLDRRLDDLREQFLLYLGGLRNMVDSMNAYLDAARRNDRRTASRMKTEIHRSRALVLNVGRKIGRSDRSILARRVEVPDLIVERIEEDAELLGRVRRLVDAETVDSYNEAVDRVNTVLKAWAEVLKDVE